MIDEGTDDGGTVVGAAVSRGSVVRGRADGGTVGRGTDNRGTACEITEDLVDSSGLSKASLLTSESSMSRIANSLGRGTIGVLFVLLMADLPDGGLTEDDASFSDEKLSSNSPGRDTAAGGSCCRAGGSGSQSRERTLFELRDDGKAGKCAFWIPPEVESLPGVAAWKTECGSAYGAVLASHGCDGFGVSRAVLGIIVNGSVFEVGRGVAAFLDSRRDTDDILSSKELALSSLRSAAC